MPLKTKTGKEVAWAFRKLFLSGSPSRLLTALNSTTNSYGAVLAANNVTLYSTEKRREIEHCETVEQNDEEYNVEVLYSE